MPQKVLGQAGISLADAYDVQGSIVGVQELDVDSIKGVHELGGQIHSERLNVFNLIADSTVLGQSVTWGVTLGAFPDSINRILSITVIADAGRIDICSVALTDPDPNNTADHVIWFWDVNDDGDRRVLWDDGTGIVEGFALPPTTQMQIPTLMARTGATWAMPDIVFRGRTTAFGAGTVRAQALIQVIRPDPGNPSPGHPTSFGLPIPGW